MPQNRSLLFVIGAALAATLAAPAFAHDPAWHDSNWDYRANASTSVAAPVHEHATAVKTVEQGPSSAWYDSNWDYRANASTSAATPASTVNSTERKTVAPSPQAAR